MIEALIAWILTHEMTIGGLIVAGLIGVVAGEASQYVEDDKKAAKRWHA